MTHGTSGMRKGISLVEMMIAIVLLGVLSVIGYKYYKNFFDTDLMAKKARMGTVIDQASQLSSAFDVYQQQLGTAPTAIMDLTSTSVQILKTLPTMPTSVTLAASGWSLTTTDVDGAGAVDAVFALPLDGSATTADKKKYCRVFNNMMLSTKSLADESSYANADGTVPLTIPTALTGLYAVYGNAFCMDDTPAAVGATPGLKIVFVKQLY